jgi:hypothetical protein
MENEKVKKKRGRKPKNNHLNVPTDTIVVIPEKKKRGRKKKYEIENFDKILNRDLINNFNHNVAYSDDDENNIIEVDERSNEVPIEKHVKNISFGNLNITVFKKVKNEENYRSNIINEIKNQEQKKCTTIDENEYSDEEKEVPIETILNLNQENFEKYYKDNKKYITNFSETTKEQSVKRIRVVTTLKNSICESDWPAKTNVCCWWCCHTFNTAPCTLPLKYDSLRKRYTFSGIFCSWNCTKAYNFHKNDHKKFERAQLISLLVKQLYGITSCINIKTAPYRECLKMFGGYMTIDDFRDGFASVDAYHLNLVNFHFIYPEVTEVCNINVKNDPKKLLRLSRK